MRDCFVDHAEPAGGHPEPTTPPPDTSESHRQLPDWALEQARSDLLDVDDAAAVRVRAWQILSAAHQLDEERHDEYDDPDLGGEA
jgi:hypothetical protein